MIFLKDNIFTDTEDSVQEKVENDHPFAVLKVEEVLSDDIT